VLASESETAAQCCLFTNPIKQAMSDRLGHSLSPIGGLNDTKLLIHHFPFYRPTPAFCQHSSSSITALQVSACIFHQF
jgi:hypothetical protein